MNKYLVLTLRRPGFDPEALQQHFLFLERLRLEGKLEASGAFTNQPGGAYLLKAADLGEAQRLAAADPLHVTGSSDVTVYEWALH